MSRSEAEDWLNFYRVSPFDDRHRYHRPAALAWSAGRSGDAQDNLQQALDWLDPGEAKAEAEATGFSQADLNTFKALGMAPPKRSK